MNKKNLLVKKSWRFRMVVSAASVETLARIVGIALNESRDFDKIDGDASLSVANSGALLSRR